MTAAATVQRRDVADAQRLLRDRMADETLTDEQLGDAFGLFLAIDWDAVTELTS